MPGSKRPRDPEAADADAMPPSKKSPRFAAAAPKPPDDPIAKLTSGTKPDGCVLCGLLLANAPELAAHERRCQGVVGATAIDANMSGGAAGAEDKGDGKRADQRCVVCDARFTAAALEAHQQTCIERSLAAARMPEAGECMICGEAIRPGETAAIHQRQCSFRAGREAAAKREADPKMEADERLAVTMSRTLQIGKMLEPCQRTAVEHVSKIAQPLSDAAMPALVKRALGLGFLEADVTVALRFIRLKAPLIIHFHADKFLKLLAADSHYRSQFETKTSGGTLCQNTRAIWEDELFAKAYKGAKPFDRPKYGSCNIVNDPNGIKCCTTYYGDSYFVLGENVRLRTTFTSLDSSHIAHAGGGATRLATCEHYAHILNEYSEQELKSVMLVATGREVCVDSASIAHYKEAQIHGPLLLRRDIEALVLNRRHAKDAALRAIAEDFAKKNSCLLVVME
jgi:hypothetical protein